MSTKRQCPSYKYIEDVERLDYYRPGGYHPININDTVHNRYRIVHKLGHGTYSTTWLARDDRFQKYVAIKIGTSESRTREIQTLAQLNQSDPATGKALLPPILDHFTVQGPNGTHPCYVTAPARISIADAKEASYNGLFRNETARALAAQLALAIAHTHSQGYIHGDLHMGNILLRMPSVLDALSVQQLYDRYGEPEIEPIIRSDGQPLPPGVPSYAVVPVWMGESSEDIPLSHANILLGDWGEAFAPSKESRYASHTPLSIRPPEVRFESGTALSFSSDIWTLACTIWSILGSRPIFEGFLATQDDITGEQVDALGKLPSAWWSKWEGRHQKFTEAGSPIEGRSVQCLKERYEYSLQHLRRRKGMPLYSQEEGAAILAMIRSMLSFLPSDRPSAPQVLELEWMTKWALPEYDKIKG